MPPPIQPRRDHSRQIQVVNNQTKSTMSCQLSYKNRECRAIGMARARITQAAASQGRRHPFIGWAVPCISQSIYRVSSPPLTRTYVTARTGHQLQDASSADSGRCFAASCRTLNRAFRGRDAEMGVRDAECGMRGDVTPPRLQDLKNRSCGRFTEIQKYRAGCHCCLLVESPSLPLLSS